MLPKLRRAFALTSLDCVPRGDAINQKIVLGFGNNIDYEIVWNSAVFEVLIAEYGVRTEELELNGAISSERDLLVSVLSFLKSGCGGERSVASSTLLEMFSERFEKKLTLGGTSVRAAVAMGKLGYTAALHLVTINNDVRKLLPQCSPYVCSSSNDSLFPHLIVQFEKGAHVKVGDTDITARQANRLIYHNDEDNISMKLNPAFAEFMTDAKLCLVSGFNAMQDEKLLVDRLGALTRIMQPLAEDAVVFYEDAGYFEPNFRQLIFQMLAAHNHIVSLNEDELQDQLGQQLDFLHPKQIAEALVNLKKLLPSPTIVIHTMYWALAYGVDAARFARALKGGVTMATTRFCFGDDFTVEHYKKIEALPPQKESGDFVQTLEKLLGYEVCCVPVAQVDLPSPTTIGLGDAFVGGFLARLSDILPERGSSTFLESSNTLKLLGKPDQ